MVFLWCVLSIYHSNQIGKLLLVLKLRTYFSSITQLSFCPAGAHNTCKHITLLALQCDSSWLSWSVFICHEWIRRVSLSITNSPFMKKWQNKSHQIGLRRKIERIQMFKDHHTTLCYIWGTICNLIFASYYNAKVRLLCL